MTRTQVTNREIGAAIDSAVKVFAGITDNAIHGDCHGSISQSMLSVENAVRMNSRTLLGSELLELAIRCLFAVKAISGMKQGAVSATLNLKMYGTLSKKGFGAFASSHEILGVITEEYKEYTEAFSENVDAIISELYDIAVVAVFGVASLNYLD